MSTPTLRRYGRRAPSNKPALLLRDYLTGVVPTVPASVDYLQSFTGWQMLGNDTYGDCVAVAAANNRAEISTVLTGATGYPTLAEVLEFYKTQNPGFPAEDQGMDMQTACATLVKQGIGGVRALGFAKVDHTNLGELNAAIAIFGSVLFGVTVASAQQDQFDQGEQWDYVKGSPIEGGHAIHTGGYGPGFQSVTWGREITLTAHFWSHQVEEAWAVIWPEHLASRAFIAGMDLATLAADFLAITGRPFPAPVPPAPGPGPVPVPAPPGLDPAAAVIAFYDAVKDWAHGHHSGINRHAADAALALFRAEGLE